MKTELYYNPNKLLSYNRILNFVIGARGIGKSFAFKRYAVNRFIKHGKQFIYVKRYKTDLKKVGNFFDDIKSEFEGHELKVKGWQLYIDGKLAGWAIPLSRWQSEKSIAYPNVETIIYDEFIKEKDKSHYIPNEPEALLNLMDTVFRTRNDVRCVCLSNSVTLVNPFFLYFNLLPDISKRYNAYKSIVVEIPDSLDFSTERRKTKFGSLIDGTDYGDMSLDNSFVNDSNIFIEKKTSKSRFKFAIVFQGMTMGIWVDVNEGLMFLSNDYDPSSKDIYALSADDHNENLMLLTGWRNNYHLYKMVSAFQKGYLRFENQVLRNIGYEMFKKMRIQ